MEFVMDQGASRNRYMNIPRPLRESASLTRLSRGWARGVVHFHVASRCDNFTPADFCLLFQNLS